MLCNFSIAFMITCSFTWPGHVSFTCLGCRWHTYKHSIFLWCDPLCSWDMSLQNNWHAWMKNILRILRTLCAPVRSWCSVHSCMVCANQWRTSWVYLVVSSGCQAHCQSPVRQVSQTDLCILFRPSPLPSDGKTIRFTLRDLCSICQGTPEGHPKGDLCYISDKRSHDQAYCLECDAAHIVLVQVQELLSSGPGSTHDNYSHG